MGAASVLTPLEHNILTEEGFRETPYKDTEGNTTVGIGFKEGPGAKRSAITLDQAVELLRTYYIPQARRAATNYVGEGVFAKLGPSRQQALIDMAYNLGPSRLTKFYRLRNAILSGNWDAAGKEILNSKYATQVPNRARRNALRMVEDVERDSEK
jgi:lysozyme